MKFPAEVLEHHANNAIPVYTTIRATVLKGKKGVTGLQFEGKNDYNNKNIIGIKLLVNESDTSKACSLEGNLLITKEWAEQIFIEVKHDSITSFQNIPLSQLIPATGESYVKVWIPFFQTSASKFSFPKDLIDTANDRDIVFALIHTNL